LWVVHALRDTPPALTPALSREREREQDQGGNTHV
jgi:hypothetical protein